MVTIDTSATSYNSRTVERHIPPPPHGSSPRASATMKVAPIAAAA
jgi:hypothetical protein